jgi:hypothetical protein
MRNIGVNPMVVKEFVMRVSNETLVHTYIRKEASYNIYARKQIEKNPAKSPPYTVYKTTRRYSPLRGFTTCYTDPYSRNSPQDNHAELYFFLCLVSVQRRRDAKPRR